MEAKGVKLPSPEERLELILLGLQRREPIEKLCEQAGISRQVFYKWMNRVRSAALTALEAEKPGPKRLSRENPEAQVQRLKDRTLSLEKKTADLQKERDHLKRVVQVATGIIRRQSWGPDPEEVCKKNSMRRRRSSECTEKSGRSSVPSESGCESSSGAGESIVAPTPDGSSLSARRSENTLGESERR